ncbi:hypothetical protein JCM8097_005212 [Rhodosporidiobolus ruineniae]
MELSSDSGRPTPPSEPCAPPASSTPRSLAGDDADQAMTDDVRTAISALGLMREGSLGAHSSSSSVLGPGAPAPHSHPTTNLSPPSSLQPAHHHSSASTSYRSDPSRSTSTASTASASEAWTTTTSQASESGTGLSSPVGTSSLANSVLVDDTDMVSAFPDKPLVGLGEAEMQDGGVGPREGEGEGSEGEEHHDPRFMERVSQLPYVSGGLEWYERSKASSRVVKLGADLVESSFSTISRPIANNVQLTSLDDFACRQLDRISPSSSSPGRKSPASLGARQLQIEQQAQVEREEAQRRERERGRGRELSPRRRGGGGRDGEETSASDSEARSGAGQQVAVAQRSRWQTVLVEAGGLGAAVSEESLKSLRYCLQWLLYATARLDHQTATLRDFILSLRAHNRHSSSSSASSSNALVAASASAHLSQIKHEVVETIRKVVEVVSKYAGAALPEQAKRYVRQSILGLPVKWASAVEQRGPTPAGAAGTTSALGAAGGPRRRRARERSGSVGGVSVAASESDVGTPRPERMHESYFSGDGPASSSSGLGGDSTANGGGEGEEDLHLSPTEEAADRVLTFAVESLDMLRTVTSIFGESVEKAEAWIERLRIVGLDRQRQRQAAAAAAQESASSPSTPFALPPSRSTSTSTSPSIGSSATGTFADDPSSVLAGTKRRRPTSSLIHERERSAGSEPALAVDGDGAEGEAAGVLTDGEAEAEAAGRRKRGAWGESTPAALAASTAAPVAAAGTA